MEEPSVYEGREAATAAQQPKFGLGDTVKYGWRGSNPNFRGRVIGVEECRVPFHSNGFVGDGYARTGYTYTVECACCETTKHLNEHALEKVNE